MLSQPPPTSIFISLRGRAILATGSHRDVYRYPGYDDYLIKVMREEALARRFGGSAAWYKRRARALHYGVYLRELKEYVVAQARALEGSAPIARMIGLAETDLGLGLVSEIVRDANDAPGPTLAQTYQHEHGFSSATETALAQFLDDMLRFEVIVGDMHAWNLIYGSDSRGGPRFVMVDGFGEKNILPLTSMSRRYNHRRTLQRYRRMREQLQRLVPLTKE